MNYAQQQHGISGTQQQQQQQQTATYYQPVRIIQAHSQQYRYQNQQHDAPHHVRNFLQIVNLINPNKFLVDFSITTFDGS